MKKWIKPELCTLELEQTSNRREDWNAYKRLIGHDNCDFNGDHKVNSVDEAIWRSSMMS